MSRSLRKFVAVLLALWLPLFSGSVMAASLAMQLPTGTPHQQGCDMAEDGVMKDMAHDDACDDCVAAGDLPDRAAAHDHHDHQCASCGICHLACSGYLAMSATASLSVVPAGSAPSGYLLSFESVTSIPLLPPPLV